MQNEIMHILDEYIKSSAVHLIELQCLNCIVTKTWGNYDIMILQ